MWNLKRMLARIAEAGTSTSVHDTPGLRSCLHGCTLWLPGKSGWRGRGQVSTLCCFSFLCPGLCICPEASKWKCFKPEIQMACETKEHSSAEKPARGSTTCSKWQQHERSVQAPFKTAKGTLETSHLKHDWSASKVTFVYFWLAEVSVFPIFGHAWASSSTSGYVWRGLQELSLFGHCWDAVGLTQALFSLLLLSEE